MIVRCQNTFPKARILVLDDNVENVRLVERFLEWGGYLDVCSMTSSKAALIALEKHRPDIILLDLHMPAPDGYEVLRQLRHEESPHRFVPILIFTADGSTEARAKALEAGASDFLTKPGDAQEVLLRVRNFLETRRLHLKLEQHVAELEVRVSERTAELTNARREAIESLARTAEFRDDETGQHTRRVGELSASIAFEMGESLDFVAAIKLAAPLHDVGKVGLTDAILLKPGRYTEEEVMIMRRHTTMGGQILEKCESPLMKLAQTIALYHHERWDGSGYPAGLAGNEIPLAARIVAVADVYDALTSERPYKPAWSVADAAAEIKANSGKHFDPRVVCAFLDVISSTIQKAA